MRLYKTELYKLCHRKIFIVGTLFTLIFQFLVNTRENLALHADMNAPDYMMSVWSSSLTLYSAAMMEAGVVIFCVISIVFSYEEQMKMRPLLLTTQEGPEKDVRAKIAAAYTVTVGLWLATTLIAVFLHWSAFGFEGLELPAGDVIWHTDDMAVLRQPIGLYAAEHILMSFLAALELCAVTLAVSAKCRSTFHSLCAAALCSSILPIIAFEILRATSRPFYLRIIYASNKLNGAGILITLIFFLLDCIILSAPFYLVWPNVLMDISGISIGSHGETGTILFVAALACTVTILCIVKSYRRYREPYHF